MARSRTIYQTEAIYVSDNIDSITKSEHKNISRVQSANYGFSINRERVNQYGQLGEIDSIVVEAPNVDFEMSYYLTNGDNEYFLNLDTGYGGFLKNQIVSSGQNIYVVNVPEGKDVQDQNWDNFSVISIGNAFVTDYTVDFGVGSSPKVNVGFSALNISSQTNLTKTSGNFIGIENAGVNPLNGVKSTQQIEVLSEINQSGQSAIRPSDTSITITPTKTLGDNDSISILSTLDSGAHIQTASLNINLDRTSLQRLGSNLAYAKVVEPPTTATVSISAIVNEVKSSSLSDILDHSNEYTIEIESVDPDGYQLCKYSLVGAKLDSESFGSAIGSNKVVDLTFTTQLGGIGQTNYNMFFEKYGFLDFFPSASAAYSLRNLTADFDQKVVRVRRESDNSERDFTEYDIKNGTMVDWVNKQVIRPLDIRELDDENGNRPDTNDFIDTPAAAYSLRSLGENQANITIDDPSDERYGETGKFVVQTRRNVDGATKSFTADEVADGTLEQWVEGWELYPARGISETSQTHFNITKTDDRNFRIVSDLANDGSTDAKFITILSPADGLVFGKQRLTFDVSVNSGDISNYMLRLSYRDAQTNLQPVAGSNSFEIVVNDDGSPPNPNIYFAIHGASSFDVTISNLKVYKSVANELPLDQATGAAAAYSLRNLSSSYTGNVVEVRRSSDNAEEPFTAAEVADGTLESWVGADLDITNRLIVPSDIATRFVVTSSTDASNYNASIDNDSASTDFVQIRSGLFGEGRYRLRGTLEVSDLVGNLSIQTNGGVASGTQNVGLSNGTNNLDFEFDITGDGSTTSAGSTLLYFLIPSGTSATLSVSNLTWEVTQADGHVRTWYDQSGSDNHAVQTDPANQPKIVEGGNLLKDSRNNPAIDFDDVDDTMDLTSDLVTGGAYSCIAYHEFSSPSMILKGNLNVPRIRLTSSTNYQIGSYTPQVLQNFTVASSQGLVSVLKDASHNARVYANGTESSSGQQNVGSGSSPFQMLGTEVSDGAANGKLVEVIYYESDQSDKRRAIEENIANHYDITLAPFSRDGTVKTWYDQSGSTPSNDAVQTDAAKQPKIVEGGNLLKLNGKPSIDFSTVDGYLELSQEVDTSNKPCSIIAATEPTNRTLIGQTSNRRLIFNSSDAKFGLSVSAITEDYPSVSGGAVFTAIHNGTSTAPNVVIYANGSASTTSDANQGSLMAAGVIDFIGANFGSTVTSYFDKKLPEVIIYNSDQSDNRTAIEANIGEHYGITGIPAYDNEVNGYVQTWYDQSGNGYDARELASQYQPLIVENGSIITDTNGKVAIKGTGAKLSLGHFHWLGESTRDKILSADGTHSLFIVCDLPDQTAGNENYNHISRFLSTSTPPADKRPRVFLDRTTGELVLAAEANPSKVKVSSSDTQSAQLVTDIVNPSGTTKAEKHSVYIDGAFNAEQPYGTTWIPDGNTTLSKDSRLFTRGETTVDTYISELIYYPSDQSANRPAIETNIANQYGITLS